MDPAFPPGPEPEETAEVFQHYRILRRPDGRLWELGRGAMGITYKAQDTNLRAPVALKLVRGSLLPDARARERFLREARAAAQLRHTHVATVYHLGEEAGACFYTMEFLDGETAEQLVRRTGPIETLTALRVASQVARALQAAHARGMLHRDLKPSNLMVLHEEGELLVKVIDFGLVKSIQVAEGEMGAGASLSQGLFQGTPLYASPEQCAQDEGIDGRSDLYSLGATLWHLLAGQPPFQGTARTVVAQHLSKPPPFDTLAASQPPAVVELLRDLLAKEPDARPPDAATLRGRLRTILDGLETSSGPPPARPAGPPPLPPMPPPMPRPVAMPTIPTPSVPAIPVRRRGVHPLVILGSVLLALSIFVVLPAGWALRHLLTRTTTPVEVDPSPSPSPSAPPENLDPARTEVAAGDEAFQRGDFEAALAAYQSGQRLNPRSPAVAAGLRTIRETADRLAAEGEGLLGKDPARALEKHRLSAALNSARGQNALADQYDAGRGVPKDFAQSLAWYRRAAETGYALAQFNLGYALANGRGVTRDDTEAARWYRLAAEQGNPFGQLNLGKALIGGRGVPKDPVEGAGWIRKAADQNNPAAQDYLGDLYLNGIGVPKDDDQAVAWYRKAADNNNALAQNDLGYMYQNGRGVVKDDVQAAEWYRRAADSGLADGQNNLGFFYQEGRGGLPKDPARAAALYRRAAEQGNAYAQSNLALALVAGRGVTRDETEAVSWYRKAAEQGNAIAQFELGYHLAMARGVARDDAESVSWYRKAAAQGNETARNNLAFMLENGRGAARDLPAAVALYRQAANAGNVIAAGNLGNIYSEGRGVPRDDNEAVRWWRKAATAGDVRCQNLLRQRGLSW